MKPTSKLERAIFAGIAPLQRPPFFEVHVAGTSVEWTSIRERAHAALQSGFTTPRTLSMVDAFGRRTLLEQVL